MFLSAPQLCMHFGAASTGKKLTKMTEFSRGSLRVCGSRAGSSRGSSSFGAPNSIPSINRKDRGGAAGLFTAVHDVRVRQQQS